MPWTRCIKCYRKKTKRVHLWELSLWAGAVLWHESKHNQRNQVSDGNLVLAVVVRTDRHQSEHWNQLIFLAQARMETNPWSSGQWPEPLCARTSLAPPSWNSPTPHQNAVDRHLYNWIPAMMSNSPSLQLAAPALQHSIVLLTLFPVLTSRTEPWRAIFTERPMLHQTEQPRQMCILEIHLVLYIKSSKQSFWAEVLFSSEVNQTERTHQTAYCVLRPGEWVQPLPHQYGAGAGADSLTASHGGWKQHQLTHKPVAKGNCQTP